MIAKLSRPRFVLSTEAESVDNTSLDSSRYHAQPHPIIVNYLLHSSSCKYRSDGGRNTSYGVHVVEASISSKSSGPLND